MKPSEINFPGDFNKIAFINLENDINNDGEIDTILYKLITSEMALGFRDASYTAAMIDSSDFLYVKGYPSNNHFYIQSAINWRYLKNISGNHADLFIVLDSLNLSMESDQFIIGGYDVPEYYAYREIAVQAYLKVFDLPNEKMIDQYTYTDTLFWDATAYTLNKLKSQLPSLEQSIREVSYFAAYDYANRIFPRWQLETRQYFVSGNEDFEKAAELAEEHQWLEAAELWDKYIQDQDRELASRANYNMAVASEMLGKLDLALKYAARSYVIKKKSRTKEYIYILQQRKDELQQLQQQL
jgi:hypothetical protein